jgi:hypothetical protein
LQKVRRPKIVRCSEAIDSCRARTAHSEQDDSTTRGTLDLIQANVQTIRPTNAQGTIASRTASVAHHPNDASVEVTSFPDPKKQSCSLNVSRLRVRSNMGWGGLIVR